MSNREIIKACLLFRDYNYSFPYKTFFTSDTGKVDKKRHESLSTEFKNHNLVDLVNALAEKFKITIHFLHYDETIRSKEYGKEFAKIGR